MSPTAGSASRGGTYLPRPVLRLADGRILKRGALCGEINDANRDITVDTTPEMQWDLRHTAPGCDPETNPAYDPVRWERFFTYEFAALSVIADCLPGGREARQAATPEAEGGNYSNKDSAYIYAHLSRKFGDVLVVRGKLPRTPRTYGGQRRMGRGQMRYWSLCSGESRVTTYTPDCVWDRVVPIDRRRRYTIVVSKAADRPSNARRACGVAWLKWPQRGDGAGDPDYGFLIMRNMLVNPRFQQAIQRVDPGRHRAAGDGRLLPERRVHVAGGVRGTRLRLIRRAFEAVAPRYGGLSVQPSTAVCAPSDRSPHIVQHGRGHCASLSRPGASDSRDRSASRDFDRWLHATQRPRVECLPTTDCGHVRTLTLPWLPRQRASMTLPRSGASRGSATTGSTPPRASSTARRGSRRGRLRRRLVGDGSSVAASSNGRDGDLELCRR